MQSVTWQAGESLLGIGRAYRSNRWACRSVVLAGMLVAIGWAGPSLAYEGGPVPNSASIVGVVKFNGTVPAPRRFNVKMGANPEFCQTSADADGSIVLPQARVSKAHEVADVVVFLQEVEKGKPMPAEGPQITIDRCLFGPFVSTGMVGQQLKVTSQDEILHQVRGWEMVTQKRLPLFMSSAMAAGANQTFPLGIKRSSILQLSCDQHRFMESWVLMTVNPYATVTGEDGRFTLTDIPPGQHTIGAWHPILGYQEGKITLKEGHQTSITLTLNPEPEGTR